MPRGNGTHILNMILTNLSVYNDAQLVLCVMILAHAAGWPKCCPTLAGSSWKIGENISAWLYFLKSSMISYRCLTRIYYSRRTREQDLLTNSSTELYVPLWTHINNLFFPRTIPEWNLLHPDTVNSETIDQFKSRLLPLPSSSLRLSAASLELAASLQLAPYCE